MTKLALVMGGVRRRAGLVGQAIFAPYPVSCQQPVELSRDDRDPGGWAGLASRHWAVGRWAEWERFLSSASALDPGLDLGFLFVLACCDPAPLS